MSIKKKEMFKSIYDHLRGYSLVVWAKGQCLTCDISCHQSLSPDDLHLHHTNIFQVLEGPPHVLKDHRIREGRVNVGLKLAQRRKTGQ